MNYKIKDLPIDERPREKLKLKGAKSLSNEELLAIIFRTGTKDYSAKDLAIKLIQEIKGFENLNELSYNYLISKKGIKEAKALTLLAAIEIGKRLNLKTINPKTKITSAYDVFELLEYEVSNLKQENLFAIFLNTQNEVITYKSIFVGTQNQSITHPREIYYEAIKQNAVKLIICHNHPSNNTNPSEADILFTKNLKEVGEILKIPLLDHVIIGKTNYFSFLEHKLL